MELERQCADIPSPKHSPSSSVSSQSLLVVCLYGSRTSTCALLEVSGSTFRRPLTDYSCPCHDHTPLIPDVSDPKQRLKELGLVKASEGVVNGNIHAAAYPISDETTIPKRDATLEKRLNIQDYQCTPTCILDTDVMYFPNPDDCATLYKRLRIKPGAFTLTPCTSPSLPQDINDIKLTDARDSGVVR